MGPVETTRCILGDPSQHSFSPMAQKTGSEKSSMALVCSSRLIICSKGVLVPSPWRSSE
jgi:hypothetical protein